MYISVDILYFIKYIYIHIVIAVLYLIIYDHVCIYIYIWLNIIQDELKYISMGKDTNAFTNMLASYANWHLAETLSGKLKH